MRPLLIASVLFALPSFGDAEVERRGNAAWEWTDEERLAVRFAPERAARIATDAAGGRWPNRPGVVAGDQTPELLLPIELFASLMTGIEGDAPLRAAYRSTLREQILAFGFDDEEFWRDLEQVASSHVAGLRRHEALVNRPFDPADSHGQGEVGREIESSNRALCASRAGALANAREFFGVKDFDRFLYTVVAQGLTITPVDPDRITPEHLRFIARGCR